MPAVRTKCVALLLIVAILAPLGGALITKPRLAHAAVPTFETNPALVKVQTTKQTITAFSTLEDLLQTLLEWAFKLAVEALKRRLLDMLVDQIIAWIQGGGTPKFITDWRGFLLDAFNAGVGDVVKQLGLGFLCSPFNLQIKLALGPIPRFSQRASCTLDEIVGNIQNFYDDFRNGGWIAYQTQWQPENNYYGALLMIYDEMLAEGTQRKEAAQSEGISNQGFLSVKRCVQEERDWETGELTGGCAKYEITTPGKTIGDTLSRAIASDIDYIVNSEDLREYIAAIANAVINRLVRAGVNGILALTTPAAPSGGYIGADVAGRCAGLTGQAQTSCLRLQEILQEKLIADQDAIISTVTAILDEDKISRTAKERTLLATRLTINRLQQLKDCDPTLDGVDQQIIASQNKATVLANEIAELNQKIDEMERFIVFVLSISEEQPDLIAQAIVELQTFGDPVSAASASDFAEKEKADADALLATVTSQLEACLARQP